MKAVWSIKSKTPFSHPVTSVLSSASTLIDNQAMMPHKWMQTGGYHILVRLHFLQQLTSKPRSAQQQQQHHLHSTTTPQGGARTRIVLRCSCGGGAAARNRVKVTAAPPRTFILAIPGSRAAGHRH